MNCTWLCKYLSSLDLVSLYTSQQSSDVVSCLCLIQCLLEHLYASYYNLTLLVCQSYDLYLVADLQHSTLYSSCSYCSTSCNGEYVLYRHDERLVVCSLWLRNVAVYSLHQLYYLVSPRTCWILKCFQSRSSDDWCVIARELILVKKLSYFHLYQVQKLLVIYHIALVQEYDDVRNAYLTGQKNVLSCLWHWSVCCCYYQDSSIHLSCSCNHVLYIVSVAWAVYVSVVSVRCLILYVCGRNCDSSCLLFRCLVDLIECNVCTQSVSLVQYLCDSCCQSCLTMVNVADSTNVDMWFGSLILLLCHIKFPPYGSCIKI